VALILNIETATKSCSISISNNEQIVCLRESISDYSHSNLITLYIQDVILTAGIRFSDLDAISVSKGPGSYTGLRIGVSTAKGLSYALDKPLISVNTLESMTNGMMKKYIDKSVLYCPMIDARRMEVYCAVFSSHLENIKSTSAEIINENSFSDLLKENKIVFLGDGAEKCKNIIKSSNAIFHEDINPSAANMADLSCKYYSEGKFENTAYFEPFYLKEFIAGKSNVKGLV